MYRINAAVWYNKKCKINGITPNYINMKVNGNNKQTNEQKKQQLDTGSIRKSNFYTTRNDTSTSNYMKPT